MFNSRHILFSLYSVISVLAVFVDTSVILASEPVLDHEDTTSASSGHESECKFGVSGVSAHDFHSAILHHKYNFVHLNLSFTNLDVGEADQAIASRSWVWTFKGEKGAFHYLYLPHGFEYWSLGLLTSYTKQEPINLEINGTGKCENTSLKIGEKMTDKLIGDMLGAITNKVTRDSADYNNSYWCYNERKYISRNMYTLCQIIICPFQTMRFQCCRYKMATNLDTRTVVCDDKDFNYSLLWSVIPFIIGEMLFLYCPLLLMKFAPTISLEKTRVRNLECILQVELDEVEEDEYVILDGSSPITLWSSFINSLPKASCRPSIDDRLFRFILLVLSLLIVAASVCVRGMYSFDFLKAAKLKKALIYYSPIVTGFDGFQTILPSGSCAYHITLYVFLSSVFLLGPDCLSKTLEMGLSRSEGTSQSPLTLTLVAKERFGSVKIRDKAGFQKIYIVMKAHIFMVLNTEFWSSTFRCIKNRWNTLLYEPLKHVIKSDTAFVFLVSITFVLYVIVVVIELVFALMLYGIPAFGFFCIVLNGYRRSIFNFFKAHCNIGLHKANIMITFVLLLVLPIQWLLFCEVLFYSCVIFSRVMMLTYTGIIAYPTVSYGYVILFLVIVYYLTLSLSGIGEKYRNLLKLAIHVCKQVESVGEYEETASIICIKNGFQAIPRRLFKLIVDRHMPVRIPIVQAVLSFSFVIFISSVSIIMLMLFQKTQQLSIVSHVFSVIFICALPRVVQSVFGKGTNKSEKAKLKVDIKETIIHYINTGEECLTSYEEIYMF